MIARTLAVALSLSVGWTALFPAPAHGFAILIDTTLAFCDVDFGGGGVPVQIGRYNFESDDDDSVCGNPALLDPFSVKIGNTTYDSVYLNNDGLLTFGSAHDGLLTDVRDAAFGPAIAGFFRDAPYETPGSGRISWGGTSNPALDDFLSINYFGPTSYYQVNIFNRDDIAAGDFDVQLNYTFDEFPVEMGLLPGQIGFNNGAGQAYEFPGSGQLDAFNGGLDDCGTPTVSPYALACSSLGSTVLGRYVLEFRNGAVVNLPQDPIAVPEPGALSLLALGIALIGIGRRRNK